MTDHRGVGESLDSSIVEASAATLQMTLHKRSVVVSPLAPPLSIPLYLNLQVTLCSPCLLVVEGPVCPLTLVTREWSKSRKVDSFVPARHRVQVRRIS